LERGMLGISTGQGSLKKAARELVKCNLDLVVRGRIEQGQ